MGRRRNSTPGVSTRTYPSGNQVIQIQFQYKGFTCKEILRLDPTNANLKYADNLKGEIENKITKNCFNYSDYFPRSKRARLFGHTISSATVVENLKSWLQERKINSPHSTYGAYGRACKALIPHIGNIKLVDLRQTHIKDMIISWDVRLKTIRNYLTPLRAILDDAIQDEIIDRSPLDKIKPAKLVRNDKKQSDYFVDPLSLNEITIFLNKALEKYPGWLNYYQFAFFSGLRTSELYGLKWQDVDWQNNRIKICRAVVERKEKETKTESSNREIDLLPMAQDALIKQRPITAMKSEYIFINPYTNKPILDYEESSKPFKSILRLAKLRERIQYQTRHSYASNLLSGGENLFYVATQMGHKDVQMVMRVYARWIEQGNEKNRHTFISDFGNFGAGASVEHGKAVNIKNDTAINTLQRDSGKVQVLFSAP